MHVGENFFQCNYQQILKLSHNLHLPITRSGTRLMQNLIDYLRVNSLISVVKDLKTFQNELSSYKIWWFQVVPCFSAYVILRQTAITNFR